MAQETKTAEPANYELPKAYDPSVIEQRWADYWVRERLFDVPTPTDVMSDTQPSSKKFTMLLPPPNVTGRLHMGHMLNQTEMDILTRWHRMSGHTALWVPGTDHAGIATQMMVERQLTAEGKSRKEIGREAFVEKVWAWRDLYGGAILDQMKRLGASVDWSREYFTMDDRLSVAVKEAFVRLYEQGLIYRGAYIVNWDPAAQTAVSDLEVEHEERMGKLYHIRYPLADGTGSIVIATTRPETMLGDTAVAVNPKDDRYLALIGKHVRLPLSGLEGQPDREIPILADDLAKPEFGTGAVKVTPAHDPNDFAIGQRHSLASPSIFDETAHVLLPGSPYHGLDRYEARERIVADLDTLGLLVAVKDHSLSIGLSQRTGAVIEPRLSQQWFVTIQPLADKAIEAVDKGYIKFTPDQYRKTYDEWMKNIHDWCISRQLWWGHRIPAWHCKACAAITVSRETPTHCSTCASTYITQETDVLDTWFSSGLLPFTVFGWPGEPGGKSKEEGVEEGPSASGSLSPLPSTLAPALSAFYPTQLLVTGFDILFFWVARMIMLGTHFMLDVPMPDGSPRPLADAVPFQEVYIHALVRDADRQKMSKTKGNVIDPIDVIERFGTDAVRFTLASMASPGTDIAFSEAARFVFMNLDRAREAGITIDLTALPTALHPAPNPVDPHLDSEMWVGARKAPLDARWIMTRLSETSTRVSESLASYRFDESASAIYQFFWGDFCDWYLELVKLRLHFGENDERQSARDSLLVLVAVFETALRLLSPFMPFLTEEIWHALYNGAPPAKSIALTRFPVPMDFSRDEDSVREMEILQGIIVSVRGLRKDMGVPEKEAASIQIFFAPEATKYLQDQASLLAVLSRLARVSQIKYLDTAPAGANTRSSSTFDVALLYERQIDIPAERERLSKDLAKYEKGLTAAERQLSNEAFMAKAPAHIVEGLRKQSNETRGLYDKTRAALEALE